MSNNSRKIAERHVKIPAKGEKNFAFRNSEILLTANETGNALPTGGKLTDLLKTAIYIHKFNQSSVSLLAAELPADAAPISISRWLVDGFLAEQESRL